MRELEVFFDIFYLTFAMYLGLKMFTSKKPGKNLLGTMAILLAGGDTFHLVPRIISRVEENGFVINKNLLLYGSKVSAVTMSIFYVLFYIYIKKILGYKNKKMDFALGLSLIVREVLVIYNFVNLSDTLDLISNIPFLVMGIIVICLLIKFKYKEELKNLWIWVFLSFAFYTPVVLFKRTYPMVGALMIPKTMAYIMMIVKFRKNTKESFGSLEFLRSAFSFLISGLIAGAFYREFGKIAPLDPNLLRVHGHLIVLGFIVLFVFFLALKSLQIQGQEFKTTLKIYEAGMFLTYSIMFLHGLINLYKPSKLLINSMTGFAGVGHILLGVSLVMIIFKLIKYFSKDQIKGQILKGQI